MTDEQNRRVLAEALSEFRDWSYDRLATAVADARRRHDCLSAAELTAEDGTECYMEFNVFWDDRPGGDVRVMGTLSVEGVRPVRLFGLIPLPISSPDVIDSFIMTSQGTFLGE